MRFRLLAILAFSLAGALPSRAQAPRLFRAPSISDTMLAVRYADDVWTVPIAGGPARRLTSTGDVTGAPSISPDGTTVAFEAHRNGVTDVYTIAITGGPARRITFHPAGSYLAGWSPDGRDLLVASMQDAFRTYFRLYRVHADGTGLPEVLPLPSAERGSFSPDSTHLAYNPWLQWQEDSWKRYRGGQTQPVWIIDLKTLDRVKIPRENSNDTSPVWLGNAVYFLSDRNGPVTLFRYDLGTREVKQLVENHGLDLKTLSGPLSGKGHMLAYEQFGTVHLFDTNTGQEHPVEIAPDGELPALAPHLEKISADAIQNAGLSPTGARALFEAHGDIFTVPAEKGDTRNLTDTSNAAEREPAWSPDGKRVAYFSDAAGEYKLYLRDQGALKPPQVIDLGPDPTYYYAPQWSPDSRRIVYGDKRLNLWYVNVDPALGPPKPVRIDTGINEGFSTPDYSASFSPDSKWILYARSLPNYLNAAFLYSLDTGKSTQITDGLSNVTSPVWDLGGKYIFFTASTDIGPAIDGFGLSSFNRTTTSSVYVTVLSKDEPSPIPPESDEEKSKDEAKKPDESKKDDAKKDPPPPVKIDLDGMAQRTLALPIPARNYVTVQRGKSGILLLGEGPAAANSSAEGPPALRSVWRFTLETRKTEEVLHNVLAIVTSADGEKILYNRGPSYAIAPVSDLNPGVADGMPGKTLHMDGMEAQVDPRAEWRQMYRETWRIEREFFYDPGFHGLDLAKISAKYEPYLAGLSTRSDLTYLQQEMLGEMTVGHMFIRGPNAGGEDAPRTGLLGADYTVDAGRYRIAHILAGGNWNPALPSPLTQPGVNVHEGEYLLAVNGKPLLPPANLYQAFQGLANQQTTITVGPRPDGSGSRDVIVVPVASEREMREQQWVEASLSKVSAMSGGQIAYVYLPNTGAGGFNNFVRYFFAQVDRKGAVIDDRWNQGGDVADYVIDVLKRTPMVNYESRQGRNATEPTGAIFGPKAMLINQNAGSGGDLMPWLFRQAGLGPLVGTRTWGGLVGIGGYPVLLDGGTITAPRTGLYNLAGKFDIENIGVSPDVEVEDDPKLVAEGHDPQLERAVALVMEDLKKHPPQVFPIPPYPNYHKHDELGH